MTAPRLSFPTWARVVVGLLVAVAGLAIAFRRVDLAALGAALAGASWWWFAVAVAAALLSIVARAWRWQLLLAPIDRVAFGQLFSATMIGYFGNGVLPLRLGELMRAAALGRRGGRVDVSTALGSIAVERLLDVASALAVAALVVPFSGGLGGGLAAWSGAAAFVIVAFGGLLWASRSAWVRRLVTRVESGGKGKVRELAGSFLRGLLILGEGPKLVPIGLATAFIWAMYAAAVWTSARAAGIPLSWLDSGLVLLATIVAVSVPAAPGYVGTYHAAVVLVAADLLGHPAAQAQAFAILSHASSWLPTVAIGALCLLRSSIKLGEVARLGTDAVPISRSRP